MRPRRPDRTWTAASTTLSSVAGHSALREQVHQGRLLAPPFRRCSDVGTIGDLRAAFACRTVPQNARRNGPCGCPPTPAAGSPPDAVGLATLVQCDGDWS